MKVKVGNYTMKVTGKFILAGETYLKTASKMAVSMQDVDEFVIEEDDFEFKDVDIEASEEGAYITFKVKDFCTVNARVIVDGKAWHDNGRNAQGEWVSPVENGFKCKTAKVDFASLWGLEGKDEETDAVTIEGDLTELFDFC